MMKDGLQLSVLAVCGLLACSQDVDTGRRCNAGDKSCSDRPRGGAGGVMIGGTGGTGTAGKGAAGGAVVGSVDDALQVDVQDIRKMEIQFITLQCAGDCADIEAVADGGNPPYAFTWEDGSTSAKRHVCLDASSVLRVSATDTAIDADEFDYDAQTVHADVTATVLDCSQPDASVPADGGEPQCAPPGDILGAADCVPPAEGSLNYYDVPVEAGQSYSYKLVGEGSYIGGEGWDYELWSSADGCTLDELLGTYSLATGPIDLDICFTPTRSQPRIVLYYKFKVTDGISFSPTETTFCNACAAP